MTRAAFRIDYIQYLRAIAAIFVVWCHGFAEMEHFHNAAANKATWRLLSFVFLFGVDIFFVISGFIMYLISEKYLDDDFYPLKFITNRIFRIVPLYWAITTIALLISLFTPALKRVNGISISYILKSYFFVPAANPVSGAIEPFVGLGWTLNFEMYFYVLFSVAILLFRRRVFWPIVSGMLILFILGVIIRPTEIILRAWTGSMILEFMYGIVLARLFLANKSIPGWIGIVAVIFGAGQWLVIGQHVYLPLRGIEWGLAALLIVGGPILSMSRTSSTPNLLQSFFLLAGNASFSLYLTHLFMMRLCTIVLTKFHLSDKAYVLIFFPLYTFAAIALSIVSYKCFETPLNKIAKRFEGAVARRFDASKWAKAKPQ